MGLLISISIIISGVIPLFFLTFFPELKQSYTIKPLALETDDGVYISAYKYTPKGERSHGGVVVAHSFFGSKLNMQPISIEIVKRGFTVINFDFRGHGTSGGFFSIEDVILDMKAAIDYLEYDLSYITEIGIVGHSLGAYTALDLSEAYPDRINATVAIGAISLDIFNISNLLMLSGGFDTGFTEEKILEVLRLYTGREDVEIGITYDGDFNNGNNTRGYISPIANHFTEIVDYAIIYQTIQWLEQCFNGEKGNNIFITAPALQFFSYLSMLGIIILNSVFVVYLANYLFKRKKKLLKTKFSSEFNEISRNQLIMHYIIPVESIQIFFFLLLSNISEEVISWSTTTLTLSLIIGAAIGSFLMYNFILLNTGEKFEVKDYFRKVKIMCSSNPGRSIIFGLITALFSVLSIAAIWHWSVQNTLPTFRGLGTSILITILSLPFFFIREFYFRNIQEKLNPRKDYEEYIVMVGIGIFIDNFLIMSIITVGKLNLAYLPPYALYLIAWVVLSIIQNCTVTWIYINSRNILSSTFFSAIFYAWLMVTFFPSYGFI
ncbi:MAG: alpha/beta hydrolase family protein [Candidatus Hermodarchaeota archaeon]